MLNHWWVLRFVIFTMALGSLFLVVLLGVLAMRSPGTRLEWDSENLKVKNVPELNPYVHTEYRKGWTL